MSGVRFTGSALSLLALATLTACGGVSHRVRSDVPQPHRIAVLPFAGPAPASLRDATRQLLHSRMQARGYHAPELAWVDQVLTSNGWLSDPGTFEPSMLPLPEVAKALDVDAVVLGTDVDESSFNLLALRRHVVGGKLVVRTADGRDYWSTDHSAGTFGGFLLTSGQVFTELRAQGEHGSPMESLALADEFTLDVSGTLPNNGQPAPNGDTPRVRSVTTTRTDLPNGAHRIVVEARASAAASLRFQLDPFADGVPMVASRLEPDRYTGALDVPAQTVLKRIAVRARDAYGREGAAEIQP